MAALNGREIKDRIFQEPDSSRRLVVTPLLEPEVQIQEGSSSIDLRLGTHFILQHRTNVAYLDAIHPGNISSNSYQKIEQREFVPFGKYLVLHPKQFILGGTLEYLSMPLDVTGYVVGRSSWGRLGLIVATAIGVHPGYRGIIILELTNVGEVPFYLRPGLTIAQLFLHTLSDPVPQGGVSTPYMGAVVPESTRIGPAQDSDIITAFGEG